MKTNKIYIGCIEEEANYIAHFESDYSYDSKYILRAKTYREVLMLIKSKTNYTNLDWKWFITKKTNKNSNCFLNFSNFGWRDYKIIEGNQVWNGRTGKGDDGTLADYLFRD